MIGAGDVQLEDTVGDIGRRPAIVLVLDRETADAVRTVIEVGAEAPPPESQAIATRAWEVKLAIDRRLDRG